MQILKFGNESIFLRFSQWPKYPFLCICLYKWNLWSYGYEWFGACTFFNQLFMVFVLLGYLLMLIAICNLVINMFLPIAFGDFFLKILNIAPYHQVKTLISFWVYAGSNVKFLIQWRECSPIELTGTYREFICLWIGNDYIK